MKWFNREKIWLDVKKVAPKPGDLLLIRAERHLSQEAQEDLIALLRDSVPEGVKAVIYDPDSAIKITPLPTADEGKLLRYPESGAEVDVIRCLFFHGPTWDGDIPSKSGRDALIEAGIATRIDGWTSLTEPGFALCVVNGLGKDKEKWQAERRRARS